MYYTYVLLSKKDGNMYSGFTDNMKLRFEKHQKGLVQSTKNRRPLELVYYSPREMLQRSNPLVSELFHRGKVCKNRDDAIRREKYSPREMISNSLK